MTRPHGGAPRALVLDDDPLIRRGLERLARSRSDVVLHTVATPEDVRERVRGATPPYISSPATSISRRSGSASPARRWSASSTARGSARSSRPPTRPPRAAVG